MLRSVIALAACAATALSAEVPVLMWSPTRQITQLQESKYTVPLSAVQQQLEDASKEAQALVLFMQDEFSHFDFSRFRGADGAAFEQLEDVLKESMSQVLPAVEAVGAQIQQAMSELAQEVQEVAGMRKQSLEHGDVEKIDLGNGRKLVVVRMQSPSATGKATQFAQNDALVGAVTKKVAELTNNNYVAVWTAAKPSEGCKMEFGTSKMRNRRQVPPPAQQKDFGLYQDRYFSQTSITVMAIILFLSFVLVVAVFMTMELKSPVRFQDPSIPMVGKE